MEHTAIEETLFQGLPDQFTSKVADDAEEACKLIEAGFDYVGKIHGTEIFRKRK